MATSRDSFSSSPPIPHNIPLPIYRFTPLSIPRLTPLSLALLLLLLFACPLPSSSLNVGPTTAFGTPQPSGLRAPHFRKWPGSPLAANRTSPPQLELPTSLAAALASPDQGLTSPDEGMTSPDKGLTSSDQGQAPGDNKTTEEVTKPIPRPAGVTPCVVTIFKDQNFSNYPGIVPVTFAPPAKTCGDTWQLVVASVVASVAGRQFDRTMTFVLDDLLVLAATTAEPAQKPGVNFGVDRDITSLSPFLRVPHRGVVQLANIVNDKYTGIFYVTLQLLFYPGPAPADGPDVVIPVPSSSVRIPPNAVSARLEVFVSQYAADEFYYTNVPQSYFDILSPNQQAGQTNGSSFREVVALLDGAPVGAIFPQPLVYSGGIDPAFWAPFMGIGSLSMPTYTLDISPFLGRLLDGGMHDISLTVTFAPPSANWIVAGALLIWRDPYLPQTAGGIIYQIFPPLKYSEDVHPQGTANAIISTIVSRQYEAAGYVVSSYGNITTSVAATLSATNTITTWRDTNSQSFDFYSATSSNTKRVADGKTQISEQQDDVAYPLKVLLDIVAFPDTSYSIYWRVSHAVLRDIVWPIKGGFESLRNTQEVSSYYFGGNRSTEIQSGAQTYNYTSSLDGCYLRQVASSFNPQTRFKVFFDNTNTTCL